MSDFLATGLSTAVQNKIEDLVLQGKLQGGDKLNEVELAEQKAIIETDKVHAGIEKKRRSRIADRRQKAEKARREAEAASQRMKRLELQRFAESARIKFGG